MLLALTTSKSRMVYWRLSATKPTDHAALEVYAFANTTVWEDFEGIQADILDHLIAAMPEFGLELYQRQ